MAVSNHPWTQAELDRVKQLTGLGWSAVDISREIGRTPGAIVTKCYEAGLQCPNRSVKTGSARPKDHAANGHYTYKQSALACFWHGKDLAEHHPKGCGELIITSDGVPKNYASGANFASLAGSPAAMCVD